MSLHSREHLGMASTSPQNKPAKKNVKHFLVLNDPFRVVNAHSCSETFQKNHLGG
jgi:hypothetical protein